MNTGFDSELQKYLGVEVHHPDNEELSIRLIKERVSELLDTDPNLLFSYLYRLDVEEAELQAILHVTPPELLADSLADAIWRRQKARLASKKKIKVRPVQEDGWDL